MMTPSNGNIFRVAGHLCGEFTGPRCFDIFFDLRLNEQLSKQSCGWWFKTPSRPLWRHSNDTYFHHLPELLCHAVQTSGGRPFRSQRWCKLCVRKTKTSEMYEKMSLEQCPGWCRKWCHSHTFWWCRRSCPRFDTFLVQAENRKHHTHTVEKTVSTHEGLNKMVDIVWMKSIIITNNFHRSVVEEV